MSDAEETFNQILDHVTNSPQKILSLVRSDITIFNTEKTFCRKQAKTSHDILSSIISINFHMPLS